MNLEMMNTTDLDQEINPNEGVALTPTTMAVVESLRLDHSAMPIHLQALGVLEEAQFDAVTRLYGEVDPYEMLANLYEGSEPREFKTVVGRTELVLGARLFQHDAFKGKDGLYHAEGYYQMQFLLDRKDEDGVNIVIKSSSSYLLPHFASIIKARGWYLFKEPQSYLFKMGSNNQHILFNKTLGQVKAGKK